MCNTSNGGPGCDVMVDLGDVMVDLGDVMVDLGGVLTLHYHRTVRSMLLSGMVILRRWNVFLRQERTWNWKTL